MNHFLNIFIKLNDFEYCINVVSELILLFKEDIYYQTVRLDIIVYTMSFEGTNGNLL